AAKLTLMDHAPVIIAATDTILQRLLGEALALHDKRAPIVCGTGAEALARAAQDGNTLILYVSPLPDTGLAGFQDGLRERGSGAALIGVFADGEKGHDILPRAD